MLSEYKGSPSDRELGFSVMMAKGDSDLNNNLTSQTVIPQNRSTPLRG